MEETSMEYGLDISEADGEVDFEAIKKAGNSFVIIRAGYGLIQDKMFEKNYRLAKRADLKIGVYWYSYALNTQGGIDEAKKCYQVIKGKRFDYPVYIDMEDNDGYKQNHGMLDHGTLSIICENFCMYLESKGYFTGVYASETWFNNELKNIRSIFDKWVAVINNDELKMQRTAYKICHYTSEYNLNGKYFNRNIVYDSNYPIIIKKAQKIDL